MLSLSFNYRVISFYFWYVLLFSTLIICLINYFFDFAGNLTLIHFQLSISVLHLKYNHFLVCFFFLVVPCHYYFSFFGPFSYYFFISNSFFFLYSYLHFIVLIILFFWLLILCDFYFFNFIKFSVCLVTICFRFFFFLLCVSSNLCYFFCIMSFHFLHLLISAFFIKLFVLPSRDFYFIYWCFVI